MPAPAARRAFDVRRTAPDDRHPLISSTLRSLAAGRHAPHGCGRRA
ncbi:hypothetical protein [Xylophilus sp.]|nr:hypothetical protein [Xylophilus sp.]